MSQTMPHAVPQLLPWQRVAWQTVQHSRSNGRLHHAQLISGPAGVGKARFAALLAQSLLCSAPDPQGMPCGGCRDCHLFTVGNHPDLYTLGPDPESKSTEIKVDSVRDMVAAEGLSSRSGRYKIIVIDPLERLNRHAANSLLKTLEEPASSTLMLLITAHPGQLLPTLRSRCQHLHIAPPMEREALDWLNGQNVHPQSLLALRLANGAPLAAQRLLGSELLEARREVLDSFLLVAQGRADPVATAESWLKQDLTLLFEWLSSWVADIARMGSGHSAPRLGNPDRQAELAVQAGNMDLEGVHRFWMRLAQSREELQSNLNPQLMLEALLVQWSELGAR